MTAGSPIREASGQLDPKDEIALQHGEEALGHRIIKAVIGLPGQGKYPHLPAPFAHGERGVLRPLVGVMHGSQIHKPRPTLPP